MFKDKTILILGSSGTLGQELIRQLLECDVHSIRAYSRNEYRMFDLRQMFGEPTEENRIRYLIGDIRDKERLNRAMDGVDICINCAAMKRVEMCEENPFEAIQTNVIGVQNAIECAIANNIEAFVQISTDKSVNPTNTYGRSKALAEDITLHAVNYQGNNRTKFLVIRSGNIKASSGSVLEIWKKQYENGEPLTITDLSAVRYMAPKEKIAKAIIKIVSRPKNGLFVLFMPKYTVKDLLKPFDGARYNIIGLRHWEKKVEELYREGEQFIKVEV